MMASNASLRYDVSQTKLTPFSVLFLKSIVLISGSLSDLPIFSYHWSKKRVFHCKYFRSVWIDKVDESFLAAFDNAQPHFDPEIGFKRVYSSFI